jgi:hypothetical protein
VAKAVSSALETGNVNHLLIWAPKAAEPELKEAFKKAMRARGSSKEAREIADLWLLETVVRLHREGEGAPYTGLKPADLDWGPVVPRAEMSIISKNPKETIDFIVETLKSEL